MRLDRVDGLVPRASRPSRRSRASRPPRPPSTATYQAPRPALNRLAQLMPGGAAGTSRWYSLSSELAQAPAPSAHSITCSQSCSSPSGSSARTSASALARGCGRDLARGAHQTGAALEFVAAGDELAARPRPAAPSMRSQAKLRCVTSDVAANSRVEQRLPAVTVARCRRLVEQQEVAPPVRRVASATAPPSSRSRRSSSWLWARTSMSVAHTRLLIEEVHLPCPENPRKLARSGRSMIPYFVYALSKWKSLSGAGRQGPSLLCHARGRTRSHA